MAFLEELLFTVALSLLASFIIAKLLSMVSASDVAEDNKIVSASRTAIYEQKHDKESAVCDVESEKTLATLSEDSVKVNDRTEEEFRVEKIDNEEVTNNDVEIAGLREINIEQNVSKAEEEEVSVGGDEVSELVFDESSKIAEFGETETQSFDETPERPEFRENVRILEDKGNMGNVSDEVNKNEEEGWFDDWEGIERTELETLFGAAEVFVGSKSNSEGVLGILDNDVKMELYGLHKVATEGPCREPQPMALKVSARAKWNAWKQRADMSPEEAMEQYVTLLSRSVPDWMGDGTSEVRTSELRVAEHDVIGVEGTNFINRDK